MNVVLNYGPRHDHDHARSDRVYLVWPTAAWRVVAPMPGERRINILQKAVLRTCQSATYTAAEIAARLHLHPDLIEAIGIELVGSGWLDSHEWRPTTKGLAVLEDEEVAMESLISGWVFQDPRTGDLWPFFASQLRLQEVEPTSNRLRIGLALPTKSGTRLQSAWFPEVLPPPGQPSAQAILSAVRRYRRREKLKGSMRLLDSGLEDPVGEGSPGSLSRITFISDQPEPAGLVTYAYVPQTSGLGPQICDPFGFGSATSMWGSLQQMAQIDEAASGAMRELLQRARVNDAPALEEQLRRHRQMAEEVVVGYLTLGIRTFPPVFEHLVDATSSLLVVHASTGESQGPLSSVFQFCRKALEAIIKQVWIRFPVTNVHTMLTGDPAKDLMTINAGASSWGFPLPLPDEFQPKQKGGPDKGAVKLASLSLGNAYKLPGAVLATMLAAFQDEVHPIRRAASRDPQLLVKIASLIRLGNAGSHDDSHADNPKRFSIVEAKEMHILAVQVAACLLDLPLNEHSLL